MQPRPFGRATLWIIPSAFLIAGFSILPISRDTLPFNIISAGAHIADTLFHELGHTLFNWLFGYPSVPMIFTLFGADQAGGMSLTWERSWVVQIAAYAMLIWGCIWTHRNWRIFFIPFVIFSSIIFCVSLTRYPEVIILYMGHGGAIMVGGWCLFRAWLDLDSRNAFERWLNAFFGFFLVLNNLYFSYCLISDPAMKATYTDHVAFGISHNDFFAITEEIYRWSVRGIAIFTIVYCVLTILGSLALAVILREDAEGFESL